MTFIEILDATKKLLEHRKRLTYGALKREFDLDNGCLADLKTEIIQGQRFAREEDGVLIWVDPPEAHSSKRQLTVMFCDLVDFTPLSQRLDPEDLKGVLDTYHEICEQAVQRFGGSVAQRLGDGVMAYFGHPIAHEDEALRGVYAALEILDELPNFNNSLKQLRGVDLSVRIGIDTGKVVVGEMGKGDNQEILAIGETPNVAARIQNLAEPNTIVISEETYKLVKGYLDTEEFGEHVLKGISRTINLRRVLGKSGALSRLEALGRRLTPLVGRDAEMELLLNRWARVKDGIGQVVMLSGDPGMGKSRLVEELKQRLRDENPIIQECRCSPFYQNTALYPVVKFFEQQLNLGKEDSNDVKQRKLEGTFNAFKEADCSHEKAVALLASLLSIPLDRGYAPLKEPPETQRQETLNVLLDVLLEKSLRRPLLLIVEDLHWIDPTTLDWLTMVITQITKARVLVVLTFRTKEPGRDEKEYAFTPPWGGLSNLDMIRLQGLTKKQAEALATAVVEGKTLPGEVTKYLIENTDGVPLFIEELTKTLLESGVLRKRGKEFEFSGSLLEEIPSTLQDSLMARLDRLSSAKQIAQLGATFGREFTLDFLQAVSPVKGKPLQKELKRLVNAGILYEQTHPHPPQLMYIFKHALIQRAAYDSLLKDRKRQFHRQIAEMLQNVIPEVSEKQPERMARHYEGAGMPEEAIEAWILAGGRALQRAANHEAIAHFGHVLTLLENIPDETVRLKRELDCQILRGPALMYVKGYSAPEVKELYGRTIKLCESLGNVEQIFGGLWGQWASHFVGGDLGPARELGEQLVHLAEKRNEPAFSLPARHAFGFSLCYRAEYQAAIDQADAGIADFDLNTEKANLIRYQFSSTTALYRFSGTARLMQGYPDDARDRAKKSLELTERLGNKPNVAFAYTSSMWFHQLLRDPNTIIEGFKEVTSLSNEDQGFFWPRLGGIFYGWALVDQGQIEEGLHKIRENLEAYQAMGGGILRTHVHCLLAEGLWKFDRPDEALATLSMAMETIKTSLEYHYEPELYRLKGEILRQVKGDSASEVEAALQKAVELSRAKGKETKWLELRAVASLCRLWQAQGKKNEAFKKLEDIYNRFSEGFDAMDLREVKSLLKELSTA